MDTFDPVLRNILIAVAKQEQTTVDDILNEGYDINDYEGLALMTAIRLNLLGMTKFLFSRGANINAIEEPSLHNIAMAANSEMLKCITENGYKHEDTDEDEDTDIDIEAIKKYLETTDIEDIKSSFSETDLQTLKERLAEHNWGVLSLL